LVSVNSESNTLRSSGLRLSTKRTYLPAFPAFCSSFHPIFGANSREVDPDHNLCPSKVVTIKSKANNARTTIKVSRSLITRTEATTVAFKEDHNRTIK